MTRFWFKITWRLALGFLAVVLFIRVQPHDDSELRGFLTPAEGCAAPCFLGIQPGMTTVEEAVAILDANEWVGDIIASRLEETDSYVEWKWNGTQPNFADEHYNPHFFGHNGVVRTINVPVTLPVIDVWWSYGQPITQTFCRPYSCIGKWYLFTYLEMGLSITTNEQNICTRPLEILLTSDNTLRYQSIDDTRAGTINDPGFSTIPFSKFNRRKTC